MGALEELTNTKNQTGEKNRVVWFDTPVLDLDWAINFYSKVLGIDVEGNRIALYANID